VNRAPIWKIVCHTRRTISCGGRASAHLSDGRSVVLRYYRYRWRTGGFDWDRANTGIASHGVSAMDGHWRDGSGARAIVVFTMRDDAVRVVTAYQASSRLRTEYFAMKMTMHGSWSWWMPRSKCCYNLESRFDP